MNVYEIVAETIIKMIDQEGLAPWQVPWITGAQAQNWHTGHAYSGSNPMLLACQCALAGQPMYGYWLGVGQAKALGKKLIEGTEYAPCQIFYYGVWSPQKKGKKEQEGQEQEGQEPTKKGPRKVLRYSLVYPVQAFGITPPPPQPAKWSYSNDAHAARAIVGNYDGPEILHDAMGEAYYRPANDTVHMPTHEAFDCPSAYYSTLFHELAHSTGIPSRLSRKCHADYSTNRSDRAKEELVAELGAAMLLALANLDTRDAVAQNAAYLKSWRTKLLDDPRAMYAAIGQAKKAADFIAYGIKPEYKGGNDD